LQILFEHLFISNIDHRIPPFLVGLLVGKFSHFTITPCVINHIYARKNAENKCKSHMVSAFFYDGPDDYRYFLDFILANRLYFYGDGCHFYDKCIFKIIFRIQSGFFSKFFNLL